MLYIILGNDIHLAETADEIASAKAAMAAYGVTYAKRYYCPFDSIAEAEAAGWEGERHDVDIDLEDADSDDDDEYDPHA